MFRRLLTVPTLTIAVLVGLLASAPVVPGQAARSRDADPNE